MWKAVQRARGDLLSSHSVAQMEENKPTRTDLEIFQITQLHSEASWEGNILDLVTKR